MNMLYDESFSDPLQCYQACLNTPVDLDASLLLTLSLETQTTLWTSLTFFLDSLIPRS